MSYRQTILADGEIYHVYNRSVDRVNLFSSLRDTNRMLDLMDFYRFTQTIRFSRYLLFNQKQRGDYLDKLTKTKRPVVELYAFALHDDHFHILIKQLQSQGIKYYLSNVQNGFAKYFNTKKDRHGSLFQNPFKANRIESQEQFTHTSRYVHLQHVTSFKTKVENLANVAGNSFVFYKSANSPIRLFPYGHPNSDFINTKVLLSLFKTQDRYTSFVENQVEYQQTLGLIKSLLPPHLRKIRRVSS